MANAHTETRTTFYNVQQTRLHKHLHDPSRFRNPEQTSHIFPHRVDSPRAQAAAKHGKLPLRLRFLLLLALSSSAAAHRPALPKLIPGGTTTTTHHPKYSTTVFFLLVDMNFGFRTLAQNRPTD